MTIKELYNWAKEKGYEDYTLTISDEQIAETDFDFEDLFIDKDFRIVEIVV